MPLDNTPTDKSVTVLYTTFPSRGAYTKREWSSTLNDLCGVLSSTHADSKEMLPWIKMAIMGDVASKKGCLRTNENVVALTGVEADYDKGQTTLDEAADCLHEHGVAGIIFPSPSYTEENPRWRILCPISEPKFGTMSELQQCRDELMDRLNGVLGGILERESWTLSQGYFFGNLADHPRVLHGDYIDLRPDLPTIPKPGGFKSGTRSSTQSTEVEAISEAQIMDMARAAAVACKDLHYPQLIGVVMSAARTRVIGHEDDAVQRKAARLIWDANTTSASLTDTKFEDAFTARIPTEGNKVTPLSFFKYARLGGWRTPFSAAYDLPFLPGCSNDHLLADLRDVL